MAAHPRHRGSHATGGFPQTPFRGGKKPHHPLDRAGRGIPGALGLRGHRETRRAASRRETSHRFLHPREPRKTRPGTLPARRQSHPPPPTFPRPHRPPADARGTPGLPFRRIRRRLRKTGGSPPRIAPLRGAHGRHLARRRPLRRFRRVSRRPERPHLPVPRLRDRLLQCEQALRPVHPRAARWRPDAEPHRGAENRHRLPTSQPYDPRGRRTGKGIPREIRRRPRPRHRWRMARPHHRLRGVPRPQVRPLHRQRFLLARRLLQRRAPVGHLHQLQQHPEQGSARLHQRFPVSAGAVCEKQSRPAAPGNRPRNLARRRERHALRCRHAGGLAQIHRLLPHRAP